MELNLVICLLLPMSCIMHNATYLEYVLQCVLICFYLSFLMVVLTCPFRFFFHFLQVVTPIAPLSQQVPFYHVLVYTFPLCLLFNVYIRFSQFYSYKFS